VKDFGKNANRNYTDAIPYKDSYKDGSRSDMQIDYVRVWQPSAKPVTTEAPTTTTTTSKPDVPGTTTTEEKPKLPNTGESTSLALVIAGVVMFASALVLKKNSSK